MGSFLKLRPIISYAISRYSTVSTKLSISETCVKQLKELQKSKDCEKYLRVIVEGGGCSGFQYKFNLDNTLNKDDM